MRAHLIASTEYRGQFQLYSDDPFFKENCGCPELLSDDLHIVNRDRVVHVCSTVAETYELTVSDEALELMRSILSEKEPESSLFVKPFDGFEWKAYQKRAINALEFEEDSFLQLSPGCGKTLMAVMMACQRVERGDAGKVVVWVPAALIYDWVKEVSRSTKLSVATPNRSWQAKRREEFYLTDDSDVWVLNYERLRTVDREPIEKALRRKRPLFILDEVQSVKGRSSAKHKELAKLSRHCGASHIALTATPIVRGPEDFYNEFRIIEPSVFGTVKDFERLFTYNCGERDIWGNYVGYVNLAKMHVMAGAHVFSADKTQPEIAKEFPSKQELLFEYQLLPKLQKVYDEIMEYGRSLDGETRQGALFMMTFMRLCNMPTTLLLPHEYGDTDYGRQLMAIDAICRAHEKELRDLSNCAKLELVCDKVGEILDSGEKVLLFAQHTHNCLYPLGEKLSRYRPLFYTGDVSLQDKERVKDEFKHSDDRNLLLMSDAGQVGLNFQECRYLIHYQTPVTHAAYEQRSDRISRVDSEFDTITVMRFVGLGTVEERVEDTMLGRRRMSTEMGFGEYEEVGVISQEDADWFCGFDI